MLELVIVYSKNMGHSGKHFMFQFNLWKICIILGNLQNIETLTIENVAFNKPATHTGNPSSRGPQNAVDGILCNPTSSDGITSMTDQISQPWWKVNLTQIYPIRYVVIQTSGKLLVAIPHVK